MTRNWSRALPARVCNSWKKVVRAIRAAVDHGVTLLDTGDFYGMGHNELLLRDALRGRTRQQVVISVKCGALRDPKGNWLGVDGRPAAVKTFLAYSLRRLGTDWIDIYRLGRVDSAVPIEDTIGAMAELVRAGKVRWLGMSEAAEPFIAEAVRVRTIHGQARRYARALASTRWALSPPSVDPITSSRGRSWNPPESTSRIPGRSISKESIE